MKRPRIRDTVEEFWDEAVLEELAHSPRGDGKSEFAGALAKFLGAKGSVSLASSATKGLESLVRRLGRDEKRATLICDFNCPTVADAIIAAGGSVEVFGFADRRGCIDWQTIRDKLREDHAAVVVPHFFGVPTDFRPIVERARKLDICVIEDCAHCLGGMIDGVSTGTIGDASIFSFNYDKPISLGGGGAVLVNSQRCAIGEPIVSECPDRGVEYAELKRFLRHLHQRRRNIVQQFAPHVRVLRRIPYLRRTVQVSTYQPARGIGDLRGQLGQWQLDRYRETLAIRNRHAIAFSELAPGACWHVDPGVTPAWLKQKYFLDREEDVRAVSRNLQRQGLRVGRFNWPRTISVELNIQSSGEHAHYVARRAVDVPIHQRMRESEIAEMDRLLTE